MKEYLTIKHKGQSQVKNDRCRYETVRNSIYNQIMNEKSTINVNIPLSKQLERFKNSVKK